MSSSGAAGGAERPARPTDTVGRMQIAAGLLEEVLTRTLANSQSTSKTTAGEISLLRQVADRHRRQPFDVEPMVLDLVETVLKEHYQTLFSSPEKWQAMVREIARTLYEDPLSRARLERLWKQLLE